MVALVRPAWISRLTAPLERAFTALSRRRLASILVCTLLPLVIRAALLPVLGMREPKTQDEFAQLLQAETFAAGRLTNPTPPLPEHFETVHVSVQPTYFSKYPPGQAVMMAIGFEAFGHPWWGVWLSVGIMCAALCWMLQRWLPPRWALLGGLLVAAKLGIFSYWMNSYWGGALAAAGGALVLGAMRGMLDRPHARDAVLMGLGALILANTRPYEGFLLCAAVGLVLLRSFVRRRVPARRAMAHVALPVLVLAVGALEITMRYNEALTGSETTLPYQLNSEQYRMAGQFIWTAPQPERDYRHEHMERLYAAERATQLSKRSIRALPKHVASISARSWLFYVAPALTVCLLALPWVLRDRRTRALVVIAALCAIGLVGNAFFIPHYAAPLLAALVALLMQGLRHLRAARVRGRPVGSALVRGVALAVALTVAARLAVPMSAFASVPEYPLTWYWTDPGGTERAWILETFARRPGRHVILVEYHESAPPHAEWVYNPADIHGAKVIWARSISPQHDERLKRRFRDRKFWRMQVSAARNELWPDSLPRPPAAQLRSEWHDATRGAARAPD